MKYKITYPNYEHSVIEEKNNNALEIIPLSENLYQVSDGDHIYEINVEPIVNGSSRAYFNGNILPFEIHNYYGEVFEKMSEDHLNQKNAIIKAPMPGLISKLKVVVGQEIQVGESLLILEAMKMENELKSPIDGVVKQINVELGATINKNAPLITIEGE